MSNDLIYNGTQLIWISNQGKTYKASSGLEQSVDEETGELVDFRVAKYQKYTAGPLPEGTYSVPIYMNGTAIVVNRYAPINPSTGSAINPVDCDIAASVTGGLQNIPQNGQGNCEGYSYPGWGTQRIRLYKIKIKYPNRENFYLHDSTKGYSHGCVEVEKASFNDVRVQMYGRESFFKEKKHTLNLNVLYPSETASTYGGTKQ